MYKFLEKINFGRLLSIVLLSWLSFESLPFNDAIVSKVCEMTALASYQQMMLMDSEGFMRGTRFQTEDWILDSSYQD